jgi:hypothetical protein
LAYEKFSDYVLSEIENLYRFGKLDFRKIYGRDTFVRETETMNLLRYFGKCLGCRLVDAGYRPPLQLQRLMTTIGLHPSLPLRITFGFDEFWRRISPKGRVLGNGDLGYWEGVSPPEGAFTWRQVLGYFEVYYYYDIVWHPFPWGGHPMSGPIRTVNLARNDPLPKELAVAIAEKMGI